VQQQNEALLIILFTLNTQVHRRRTLHILWCIDPLLNNDWETNVTTAVTMQRPARQWTSWKAVFSAGSAPMAGHAKMATNNEDG
jgi:hypothetical protein